MPGPAGKGRSRAQRGGASARLDRPDPGWQQRPLAPPHGISSDPIAAAVAVVDLLEETLLLRYEISIEVAVPKRVAEGHAERTIEGFHERVCDPSLKSVGLQRIFRIVNALEIRCAATNFSVAADDVILRIPNVVGGGFHLQLRAQEVIELPVGRLFADAQRAVVHRH